jgi:ribonuclease HI
MQNSFATFRPSHQSRDMKKVTIYTDGACLGNPGPGGWAATLDGITNRIHGWKARAWKKKIKNRNLWLQLDDVCKKQRVTWHWVRAHSGTLENERCDMLAVEAAQKATTR